MSLAWTSRLELCAATLDQIDEVAADGGPVAQHVTGIKTQVAQLLALASEKGADAAALQRVLHRSITILLTICKSADVSSNTTVRDGLQLIGWQVVTRGKGSQAVLTALLDALRPKATTPSMQRTALEVLSALAGATDNAQRVVILKGLAETLSLLLDAKDAQSDVLLKAYGACSLMFAPPLLPAAPSVLYEALSKPTSALLKHSDQAIRRSGAVAAAALLCYGRPNLIPETMGAWQARCGELDLTKDEDLAEAKGIVICVGETAKIITASNPSASGHILTPLLRCIARFSTDVVQRYTDERLGDTALVTAVLGAFHTIVGLQKEPVVRAEVLQQSGWADANVAAAQCTALLPWLSAWSGKGSESVVSCILDHIGHLAAIVATAATLRTAADVLQSMVSCDDAAVKASALVAIARVAVAFVEADAKDERAEVPEDGGDANNCSARVQALLRVIQDVHADSLVSSNDTYAQKASLTALGVVLPTTLRCADAAIFAGAQAALSAAMHDHAASKEIGCWSGVWTVAYELVEMLGTVPWRVVSDDRLVDAALWWLLTCSQDADDRVRVKACRTYSQILPRLPCVLPAELHAPNRGRAASTALPPAAQAAHASYDTLLRTPHAADLAGFPPHAGRLLQQQLAGVNIAAGVRHTLHALAVEMGASDKPSQKFTGYLRILWSLSATFGYAGADCVSLLSPHAELAVSVLLRALQVLLAQRHIQLKQVALVMQCLAGFVAGGHVSLQHETYRTLLVDVALLWSLITAAITHLIIGSEARIAPETIISGAMQQLQGAGTTPARGCGAYMSEKVVQALLDAKAVAYRATFAAGGSGTAADTVPEGFVGISQVCVALLAALVEEAVDQTLVCGATDCVLKVVTLHRMLHGRQVLGLLTSLFRASYGHPDMTRKTPMPLETRPPVGAVPSRRALKAAAKAAPLSTFLNPILESVQLYFKSLDPGVPAAALRLLYTLHSRGVDFARLDPQREIAKRLCAIGQKQIEGWLGREDGGAAGATEHNLPVIYGETVVQLLRLLHQVIPCISQNLPKAPQFMPVRDVLLRADQSCTPQLIDSLIPLLLGPFANETARSTFFASLPDSMPCGGYTLALCLQVLMAVGADKGEVYVDNVADFLATWCGIDWLGMDVREESIEALADLCSLLAQRLSAARLRALIDDLVASDMLLSLVAVRALDVACDHHTAVVNRLTTVLQRRARVSWGTLQTYAAVKLLSLLRIDVMAAVQVQRVVACLCNVRGPVESRLLSAVSRFVKRALSTTGEGGSRGSHIAVVQELLTGLATVLHPWVEERRPPPIPTSVLLYASVLFDCIAFGVSATGSKRVWRRMLSTPAAWFCLLLGTFRSASLLSTIARTVQTSVAGSVAHPQVDAALAAALAALAVPPASGGAGDDTSFHRRGWLIARIVTILRMLTTAPPVPAAFPGGEGEADADADASVSHEDDALITGFPDALVDGAAPPTTRNDAASSTGKDSRDKNDPQEPPSLAPGTLDRFGPAVNACVRGMGLLARGCGRGTPAAATTHAAGDAPLQLVVDGVVVTLPEGLSREDAVLCTRICGGASGHLLLAAAMEAAGSGGRRTLLEDIVVWLGGVLPAAVAVRALEGTPGGAARANDVAAVTAAVCTLLEKQLAVAVSNGAALTGLLHTLDAVGVLVRDHLREVAALPHVEKHLHVFIVATAYAYDMHVAPDTALPAWEACTVFLSILALAYSLDNADIPEDIQEDAMDGAFDAAELTWRAVLEPAAAPSTATTTAPPPTHGGIGWRGLLFQRLPFRAAWKAVVTRALHCVLASFGIGFEYDLQRVLTTSRALGRLAEVVTNVLLNADDADRATVAMVLGWEALKASPKLGILNVSNEVVMALEDPPSLPAAVGKLRVMLASFGGCPKALLPTIADCVALRLLDGPEGNGDSIVGATPTDAASAATWHLGYRLVALLVTLCSTRPSSHFLVAPAASHSVAGHPPAVTHLLSATRGATPVEVAGGGAWRWRERGVQSRNLHWPDALPIPRHLRQSVATDQQQNLFGTFITATHAVLAKPGRVPSGVVVDVLQEASIVLTCGLGDGGCAAASVLTADAAAHLSSVVDKLPKADDRWAAAGRIVGFVSSTISGGGGTRYSDATAGDTTLVSGTMPAELSGADPLALEAAALVQSVMGVHKDIGGVVTPLADAHEFTAPAYALCVTLLPKAQLEKCVPAAAAGVAQRVVRAYDLGYGRAFVFLGIIQMVKRCIEGVPSASESSGLTRHAWEVLLTKLTGDDACDGVGGGGGGGGVGLPYTTGQLAWTMSACYALLAHYYISHAQRETIAAMASLPATPGGLGGGPVGAPVVKSANQFTTRDVLLLGLMLCAVNPMLVPRLDADVGHRQALALVERLRTPVLVRTAQPVLALLQCCAARGLHWQQGLPLVLRGYLLTHTVHHKTLVAVLPSVLERYVHDDPAATSPPRFGEAVRGNAAAAASATPRPGPATNPTAWVWLQALVDGALSHPRPAVRVWNVAVIFLALARALGHAAAWPYLAAIGECYPTSPTPALPYKDIVGAACRLFAEDGRQLAGESWEALVVPIYDNLPDEWRAIFRVELGDADDE